MLVFGNGEVRLRNNSHCDIIVNGDIFGSRVFRFRKEEVVGKEERSESIPLASFELHRLDTF